MFIRHAREFSMLAAYALLLVLLRLCHPEFFRNQFLDTWIGAAPILVAATGMTLIILARHIDISIGAQYAICAVLAALLARTGMPMPLIVVLTLAAGAVLGATNGALICGLGLPSIVVTLATMAVFRQALLWASHGEIVNDMPVGFQWFGLSQAGGRCALIVMAAVVFMIFAWAMRWISAGRAVYAVGSDQEAARLAGIRPRRVVFAVFVLMGGLTALAALFTAVQSSGIDPHLGTGWELTVIAGVVVGGTAISGGRGTLIGTLFGVALLQTIGPTLGFFGLPPQWDNAVRGLIILLAVSVDGIYRRAR